MYESIPGELKRLPQWVCWKALPDESRPGRIKKIPVNPRTGGQAQSNNPGTWATFDQAVKSARDASGIGFMFAGGYFGVDIDGVEGDIQEFKALKGETPAGNIIAEFIHSLRSYAEYSVSGRGLHIICRGSLPASGRRRSNVEMYETGRFFIMTGNMASEYGEVADCTEAIRPLHEKYIGGGCAPGAERESAWAPASVDDAKLLSLAQGSKQGQIFSDLYQGRWESYFPSQSEADMSLCGMLAFWTGRDEMRMDRLFRASGLMRGKWDRRQAGSTYGRITLQKAVKGCRNVYDPSPRQERKNAAKEPKKLYSFDDTGNAERLFDTYGESIRFSFVDKKWLYYDGRKWCQDNTGSVKRLCDQAVDAMENDLELYLDHAPEDADLEAYKKQFQRHVKASRSSKGKTAMLKETEHRAPILPGQMDRHTDLLNTLNGIVQLRTGEMIPHDPRMYLSRVTHAEYTDKIDCPQWEAFLRDIFAGDWELIRYIQKAAGYSITGSTQEQCAFFLYGTGKNGKTTFLDSLSDVLGDYAMNIQPETLMLKNAAAGAASGDVARLKGARLVTSAEPNEGMRLNEGLLKQLTGGDKVTARKLYGEEFEFSPEFKLWMAANHKPVIRGTDLGIWRRIHLIPFTVQIPPERRDPHLKYKLRREAQGILKWAVDGCLIWQREGLQLPAAVLEAVKEYKSEMDVISAFLSECVIKGPGEVAAGQLYKAYVRWAEENNEYKMSGTRFGKEMGLRAQKTHTVRGWAYPGLALKAESSAPYSFSHPSGDSSLKREP